MDDLALYLVNDELRQIQVANELKRFFCKGMQPPGVIQLSKYDLIRFYVTFGPDDGELFKRFSQLSKNRYNSTTQ